MLRRSDDVQPRRDQRSMALMARASCGVRPVAPRAGVPSRLQGSRDALASAPASAAPSGSQGFPSRSKRPLRRIPPSPSRTTPRSTGPTSSTTLERHSRPTSAIGHSSQRPTPHTSKASRRSPFRLRSRPPPRRSSRRTRRSSSVHVHRRVPVASRSPSPCRRPPTMRPSLRQPKPRSCGRPWAWNRTTDVRLACLASLPVRATPVDGRQDRRVT